MEKVVKLIWKGEDMAKAANRLIANNKKARHDYFIEILIRPELYFMVLKLSL